MNKKNRIIVLIDLSEYSENLINFAFSLSQSIQAKVVLVHQLVGTSLLMADPQVNNEIFRLELEEASAAVRRLTKGRLKETDSFHISQEPILKTLRDMQSGQYTDWVLAGLKGTGVLKRIFIGSTTLSIIDETDLLTVAVPVRSPISVPKKLIVGINCHFPLNKGHFNALLSSFEEAILGVEFFTILQDGENETLALRQLNELKDEYKNYNSSIFISKGENKYQALREHVEENPHSFLVLQQGSRSLQDKLLRKFMVNEMVYTGLTPLIVISK